MDSNANKIDRKYPYLAYKLRCYMSFQAKIWLRRYKFTNVTQVSKKKKRIVIYNFEYIF